MAKREFSDEHRRHLSEAQKLRWAEGRGPRPGLRKPLTGEQKERVGDGLRRAYARKLRQQERKASVGTPSGQEQEDPDTWLPEAGGDSMHWRPLPGDGDDGDDGTWRAEPDEPAPAEAAAWRAVSARQRLRSTDEVLDSLGTPREPRAGDPGAGASDWARAYALMTEDQRDAAAGRIARWREGILKAGGTWRPMGRAG